MFNQIKKTITDIVKIDCVSKSEQKVSKYVQGRLEKLGIQSKTDEIGNILAFVQGNGEPILLNAHLDRVPPGRSVKPIFDGTILKTDGSTNLGADDAAGITIILELLEYFHKCKMEHPPLDLVFTVQEEIGLFGAQALNLKKIKAKHGIIFDNAFEAGVVVSSGSSYHAFDMTITGKSQHSGKNISKSVNSLLPLLLSNVELGELDDGQTRVNIGRVESGSMRNAVPETTFIQGEIRSFLTREKLDQRVKKVISSIENEAKKIKANVSTKTFSIPGYTIYTKNSLLIKYKKVLSESSRNFVSRETFVGSDGNALRGIKGLDVFVLSTGVANEHTSQEYVDLKDLEQIVNDMIGVIS